MKKFFTLCLALLALTSMPAMAQDDDEEEIDNTFQFYQATINGKDTTWTLIENGSTYNANIVDENPMGGAMISSGLYVRNTSSEDAAAQVHMRIVSLPTGSVQFCMLGNCASYNAILKDNTKSGTISAGHNDDMMLEWNATDYGTATVTLQANPAVARTVGFNTTYTEIGIGPRITVNFIYPNPTGIKAINADNKDAGPVTAIYNLRGEQLTQLQKGVNIVRYANGTAKKVIK